MKIGSTLHKLIPTKDGLKKQPITSIFKAAVLLSPVTAGAYLAGNAIKDHGGEINTTLGKMGDGIKSAGNGAKSTLESGAHLAVKGAKSVGSGLEHLLLVPMAIGALVVVMMILKK